MASRADHTSFRPPKPSRTVTQLVRWALPRLLRLRDVVAVECAEEDLRRLRALRDERVAIVPNHPTGVDPAILFHVSKLVGQPFYYLAAREVFDLCHGLWGWLVQRVGGYSIVRGTPDRAAFKMTRDLLARAGTKLIIFPEGETYSQNDSLLPFHSGITQLMLWAQEDVAAEGKGDSIHVLPVAVKYHFVEDMGPAIEAALARLEKGLALDTWEQRDSRASQDGDETSYPRLRRVGARVVAELEPEYGLRPPDAASLADRMNALKLAIVDRVAGALGVRPRDETLPDRMRYLVNALHEVTDEEPASLSDYQHRLWEDRRERLRPLIHDLDRLGNWIAVYDGYVSADPTPERMAELIWRLEVEVFGPLPLGIPAGGIGRTARLTGKRRCTVRIAEPIKLAAYLEQYRQDKRQTVAALTQQFEGAVQAMLSATK